MTILITGAAGFVGLALAEYLLARGDNIIAADIDALPERAVRDFARLPGRIVAAEQFDASDSAAYASVVARHRPLAIVHLAALTPLGTVPPALAIRLADVNVKGPLNAVAAAAANGSPFIVVASSGGLFGAAGRDAPVLDHRIRPDPITPYGAAKFAGERLSQLIAAQAGVPLAAVRLSTIFGRWERATPVRPAPSAIMQLTDAALRGEALVVRDNAPRDYLYSTDCAAGLAALVDYGQAVAQPLHLSTTTTWSLPDWCTALEARCPGFTWRVEPAPPKPNDRTLLDTEALAALTGFRARLDMKSAMDDYLAWRA